MIQFNYDDSSSSSPSSQEKAKSTRKIVQDVEGSTPSKNSEAYENRIKQLTVFQTRQINGCLIRAPTTFYTDIW